MSTNLFNPDDWVSQAEAARIRGVSRQAIARLVKKGRLHVWPVGGRTLVRRVEIETFEPEPAGRRPNDRADRRD
ncbi:helix-turn-helix domain-containing protein [Tunturibacter empetritectus]|uniref:helix-turn-helix domain-containing protein n=1 Tax=Tunturiibacter empetritectus TaxID=3069691 RepID=UPI0033426B0A